MTDQNITDNSQAALPQGEGANGVYEQQRLWEEVYKFVLDQWSAYEGKVDEEGFIELCMEHFLIKEKK